MTSLFTDFCHAYPRSKKNIGINQIGFVLFIFIDSKHFYKIMKLYFRAVYLCSSRNQAGWKINNGDWATFVRFSTKKKQKFVDLEREKQTFVF